MLMIAYPIHPRLAQRFDVDCTIGMVGAKVKRWSLVHAVR
jgi:hypothetical protein